LKKRKEKEKEKKRKEKKRRRSASSFNFVFNVDNLARNQLTRSWMLQVKNNLKKKTIF
jgi:hypothetical protein